MLHENILSPDTTADTATVAASAIVDSMPPPISASSCDQMHQYNGNDICGSRCTLEFAHNGSHVCGRGHSFS